MKNFLQRIYNFLLKPINQKIEKLLMLQDFINSQHNKSFLSKEIYLENVEFSVFSQNGKDGTIDFPIKVFELNSLHSKYPQTLIEFDVENYTESNTYFLLKKHNWQGCVIDGLEKNIRFIKKNDLYWQYDLEAICSFITKDNIKSIITHWLNSRSLSNVALLSIDIDGVDYVWENIFCISPIIVIIKFNTLFDADTCVSVPYREDFIRHKVHFSGLFFDASIAALINLGTRKGYKFIDFDKSKTNLFFVHNSLTNKCSTMKIKNNQKYCDSRLARQSRNKGEGINFSPHQTTNANHCKLSICCCEKSA